LFPFAKGGVKAIPPLKNVARGIGINLRKKGAIFNVK
jgi:hypothetical protein